MEWNSNSSFCVIGIAVNVLVMVAGCKKEVTIQLPSISTAAITSITTNTAVSGGIVGSEGSSPVTMRGVCWNTSPTPLTSNSKSVDAGTATFSSSLAGLTGYTTYYVRAYATNNEGTAYGTEVSFTTLPGSIKIGAQIWMDRNLNVIIFRNGDPILNVTSGTDWTSLTKSAYADYNNSVSSSDIYGRLYNAYAVTDSRNLCPAGWHVPSDDEWTILSDFLGGLAVAGSKMKETGTSHWLDPNTTATNESGFTALPGGHRYNDGSFFNMGTTGYWWTSTATSSTNADYRVLKNNSPGMAVGDVSKVLGCSVRCIKD